MEWGKTGPGDGEFRSPYGVAVHPTRDLVFISDFVDHRVQAFTVDGRFLFAFGSKGSAPGQFHAPGRLSLDSKRDLLFVPDRSNARIQVFDLNGKYVFEWSSGRKDPSSIAADFDRDCVYVSHFQASCFFKFALSY